MSGPGETDVAVLADRVAEALRRDRECQGLVVSLASRAGWRQARRLVLARVGRGDAASGGVA